MFYVKCQSVLTLLLFTFNPFHCAAASVAYLLSCTTKILRIQLGDLLVMAHCSLSKLSKVTFILLCSTVARLRLECAMEANSQIRLSAEDNWRSLKD